MASNKGKCQVCAAISESFCSWCKLVFYCSREHQKKDWPNHKETCTKKKYRMEENDQLGRHLVASEDIKPDLILFKDKPLILSYKLDSLEYMGNKICLGCYKEIPLMEVEGGQSRKTGKAGDHYRKDKDEDRRAQMKRAAAVASLLQKVVAVDKERKQAGAATTTTTTTPSKTRSRSGSGPPEKRDSSVVAPQSKNNERDGDDDDDHDHGQRENDGGDDQQDNNNSDESSSSVDNDESDECGDNSNEDENEFNDDDSSSGSGGAEGEEKVCLSCRLPICSQLCSTQYFHKNFECKLVREAYYHKQQQQLLQTETLSPSSGGGGGDPTSSIGTGKGKNGEGKEKQRSNQDLSSVSPGTTCKNTSRTSTASSRNMITTMRHGIREILLRNLLYLRCLLLKHVNEGHWNQLLGLQSNEEARKGDVAGLEKTTGVFTALKKILTEINHPVWTSRQLVHKPDIHKLVGIIEINGLNVSVSQNVEVTLISPIFSLMEHSCCPTVKYAVVPCGAIGGNNNSNSGSSSSSPGDKDGGSHKKTSTFLELYCRSAVKLKTGDHLSVSYVNLMWNTDKRREFLKKERHFWCECSRCMDKTELGSNFSTILCPIAECKGYCAPVPAGGGIGGGRASNNNEIQWKCTSAKCGKTIAFWQVKILDTKLCEMVGRTKPSIEGYKECLAKMEELVHPDYYLRCIVTHSLIQMIQIIQTPANSVQDKALFEEKVVLCQLLLQVFKKLDPGLANLHIYASIVFYEIQNAILALAGAEIDDDFHILRSNPGTVNLAKVYLQKCIDCFKYEFFDLPENKLKILAKKKMEYLNAVMSKR